MRPENETSDPGTEIVEWRREFPGPVRLVVDQESPGPVTVTGWDQNTVEIVAVKQARDWASPSAARELLREAEVSIEANGVEVRVETEGRHHWGFWRSETVKVAINVSVPRGSSAEVEAGSGRIEVRDTRGPVDADNGSGGILVRQAAGRVRLDVGSGSVTVEEVDGDLEVEIGSGSVTAERIRGAVEIDGSSGPVDLSEVEGQVNVDTGSGSVRLSRIIGPVSVDTGSGGVKLSDVRSRSISVDTGSGGILADFDVDPAGSYSFDTGSGGISLTIPDDASFSLSAETGSGAIDCPLPLSLSHSGRGHIEGVKGDGSARIQADTSSGSFSLRTRNGPRYRAEAAGGSRSRWAGFGSERPDAPRTKEENRDAVLKMVQEGKLTAEQGAAVLAALESPPPEAEGPAAEDAVATGAGDDAGETAGAGEAGNTKDPGEPGEAGEPREAGDSEDADGAAGLDGI